MDFSKIIAEQLKPADPRLFERHIEPLADLDYTRELLVKNASLRQFWSFHKLPGTPQGIIAAPVPRGYRTTTKRSVNITKGKVVLHPGLNNPHVSSKQRFSLLEPEFHRVLYDFVEGALNGPKFKGLSKVMHLVIIRGGYKKWSVILNVSHLDRTVVRAIEFLAAKIQEFNLNIASCFSFLDPTRSPYYLDSGSVPGSVKLKKYFGMHTILFELENLKYMYYPDSFSQVNGYMIPELLMQVKNLLRPSREEQLLDLFCGYGLFSHYLAPFYSHVTGVEAHGQSVEAAKKNSKFHNSEKRTTFLTGFIDGKWMRGKQIQRNNAPESILADPPRAGIYPSTITTLAERKPLKVLQACCGIEAIPEQVKAWNKAGYHLKKAAALDMFPGTCHLEVLLLFEPARPLS